jgi:TonB family protein
MRNIRRDLSKALFCGTAALILSAEIVIAQSEPNPSAEKTAGSTQPGAAPGFHGNVGVVSDTQGVNFEPYVSSIFKTIHAHWLDLVPDASLLRKQEGNVTIEFSIARDGKLEDLKFLTNSGEPLLDRAAQAGILASSPFPALPAEFKEPSIRLRLNFVYRPWTSVNIDSSPSATETSRPGPAAAPHDAATSAPLARAATTTAQTAAPATAEKQAQKGGIEILSDTQGVNFGSYLRDSVLRAVRENWYRVIPQSAVMKKGTVGIEFAILKNGHIAGMKLVASSGMALLDRAAWGGISACDPFPALPAEFKGDYLTLRFRFLYNPDKATPGEHQVNPPQTPGSQPPTPNPTP